MPKSPCGKQLVPFRQAGEEIVGRWSDKSSVLMSCPDCGYLAFDPLPTDETLTQYYGSQYWEMGGSMEEARDAYASGQYYKDAAREIVDLWRSLEPDGAALRVHEVGCGYGATVHALRALDVEATGSDLSTTAVETAKALDNPHTYANSLSDFLEARPNDPINFFFMAHSLEHMPDPAAAAKTVYDRLPDGGVFMFRVPNGMHLTSRLRSFYEYTWLQYPDHIHYFTPNSAICLLEQAGFAVTDVSVKPREDHAGLMYPAAFGRAWGDLPEPGALLDALARNWLGMELQVIARKGAGAQTPAELRERAQKFERRLETMQAADLAAGANAADFSPQADHVGKFRYLAMNGDANPVEMTPSADGKALENGAGARVQRAHLFVPMGQSLILNRTLPRRHRGQSDLVEVSFSIIMPHKEGDRFEVAVVHKGRALLREEFSAAERHTRRLHLRARPKQQIEIHVRPVKCEWPSLFMHCSADWVELA